MMKLLVAGAVMLAASTVATQNQQMTDLARTFTVSGPTSFADGKIRGGTVGVTDLKPNQTIELFQTAGKSLCASSLATRSAPDDAGYGWRLRITPLSATDGLVMDVEWQRMWDRGVAITSGPRGRSRITLHAGDKILLDYIPAPDTEARCTALGMGLQLELADEGDYAFQRVSASAYLPVAEADLWLIRSRDGQTVERQIVRARLGAWTEFFFKDMAQTFTDARFFFFNDPRAKGVEPIPPMERTLRASGRIRISDVKAGRTTAEVDLSVMVVDGKVPARGSAVFEFSAGPTEVVDFRMPLIPDNDGRMMGAALSIRVQLKPLGR